MTDAVGLGKDLPRFFSTWDEVLPGAGGHRPSRRGGSFRSAGGPEGPWGPGSLGWQVQGAQEVTKDPRGTSLLSRSAAPSKRAPGPGSGSTSETRAWNQLQPPGQTLCLRKGNRTSTQMSSSRHRPPPVVYYRLRSLCRPPSSRGGTLRTSMLTGLGPQRASFVSCWLLWSPLPAHGEFRAPASPPLQSQPAVPFGMWHRSPLLGRAGFVARGVARGQWSVLIQGSRDVSPSDSPWTSSLQAVGLGVWGPTPACGAAPLLGLWPSTEPRSLSHVGGSVRQTLGLGEPHS